MAAHCSKCKCKACAVCSPANPPSRPAPSPPKVFAHTSTSAPDTLGCVFEYSVSRFDPRSFKAQVTLNMYVINGPDMTPRSPAEVQLPARHVHLGTDDRILRDRVQRVIGENASIAQEALVEQEPRDACI